MSWDAYAADMLKWAKYYAQLGMIPVPCYGLLAEQSPDGTLKCACKKPDCTQPGKHPMLKAWNLLTSPAEGVAHVSRCLQARNKINIAILTGASGILVVDLDVKSVKGEFVDGLSNFFEMAGTNPFPEAPHQVSGGGGHHFFLSIPIDSKLKTRNLGKGVEFKTHISLVHVYPSQHKSGGSYIWDPPPSYKLMPPPCPEWILAKCRDEGPKGANGGQVIPVTAEELKKLAKKWSSSQSAGVEKQRNGRTLGALVGLDLTKPATSTRLAEVLPDGSRLTILQLMGALGPLYSQIKTECVLESLKPAIEWRCSQGHSTDYSAVATMLRDAQTKALVQRNGWRRDLVLNEAGKLLSCTSNVFLLLRNHPEWEGVLAYDIRNQNSVFLKQPPSTELSPEKFPHPIEDRDLVAITSWFAKETIAKASISKAMVADVIDAAAYERLVVDPVKDYFESLVWDETPRLDYWLQNYAGVTDSLYTRRIGATYLISAVARTYWPGCKVDHVLIFEGDQGFQKSTLIEALVPHEEWISTSRIDLDSKDGKMQLTGKLFIELPELGALKKGTVEQVKAFITEKTDDYRPPFERKMAHIKRRSVFAASTNEQHYFVDDTGNRRFWPVRCNTTDQAKIQELMEIRDQIWAEAIHRYKTAPANPAHLNPRTGGEMWWLTKEEEALARVEQDKRSEGHDDVWLGEFLDDWRKATVVSDDPAEPKEKRDAFASVDDPTKRMLLHPSVNGPFAYTHELLRLRGEKSYPGSTRRLRRIAKILGWEPKRDSAGACGYILPERAPARAIFTANGPVLLRVVPSSE